jgi:CSLREA domain-containing protein
MSSPYGTRFRKCVSLFLLLMGLLLVPGSAAAQTSLAWTVEVPDRAVFFEGDPRETVYAFGACPVSAGCRATLTPEVPARVPVASVQAVTLGLWSPFDRQEYVFSLVFAVGTERVTLVQDAHFAFVGTGGPAFAQWRFLAQVRSRTETVHLGEGRTLDVTLLPWGGDTTQTSQSGDIVAELVLHAPATLPGTTIKVSTTADDDEINGNCTLREAIIAANADAAVDRCPAGSGSDTVVVPAGTFLLSLVGRDEAAHVGDLDVVGTLAIRGAGADATIIDAGSSDWPRMDRVVHVLAGADLTLSRLTVRGGNCWNGGGIFNAGTLTVVDARIRGNLTTTDASGVCGTTGGGGGAGILNAGTLTLVRCTVSGNRAGADTEDASGGALLNRGTATIEASDLSGNWGASGGGIMNHGDLRVTDSTIGSNGGRFWGAGLHNRSRAVLVGTTIAANADGGILHDGEFLEVRNSTVSANWSYRVAGSIIHWSGTASIVASTIADNRSSRAPDCIDGPPCPLPVAGTNGPLRLENTIVSNPGYGDCWSPVESLGYNLDHDGSCGLHAPGDLPNTDPLLGPLADNGGPTRTHALRRGSPAVDHVPAAACAEAVDQRGVPRPQPDQRASPCDVGAYEFSPAADIRLLIEKVQRLGAEKRMLQPEVDAVLHGLKLAWLEAVAGQPGQACAALGGVASTITAMVANGSIEPTLGRELLGDVARIGTLVCS